MECRNCHTEFIGNFCPSCGQPASTQRFTIKNVLMSTMEVWGMGNRSLPRTLFHLFTRPGQMIGEYLDGRRMPFFPPVKMLFVLCIFFAVASALVGNEEKKKEDEKVSVNIKADVNDDKKNGAQIVDELTDSLRLAIKRKKVEAEQKKVEAEQKTAKVEQKTAANGLDSAKVQKDVVEEEDGITENGVLFDFDGREVTIKDLVEDVKAIVEWLEGHKAIELLCLHSFFMVFAWCVFRKSPVRPKTTLPENFFAQVYISGQMMAASIVYILIFGNEQGGFYPLPWWMLLGLFVWDFKYLYGFSWKSTIRRTILIHIFSTVVFVVICVVLILLVALASEVFFRR